MLKITDTFKQSLLEVYGEKENSCERFMALTKNTKNIFIWRNQNILLFLPGRMELIGNHTDPIMEARFWRQAYRWIR